MGKLDEENKEEGIKEEKGLEVEQSEEDHKIGDNNKKDVIVLVEFKSDGVYYLNGDPIEFKEKDIHEVPKKIYDKLRYKGILK